MSGTAAALPWALLLGLSYTLLLHVPAARADVIADCNQTDNPERAIRACSTYLDDRTATPQNRATAYVNRAIAYSLQRDFDQALSDYDAAIQLDPTNPLPYYNRGNLYFDSAITRRRSWTTPRPLSAIHPSLWPISTVGLLTNGLVSMKPQPLTTVRR
jgi:tetratricopeptide (TPR) repeat protein